jgi:hypothetical protein
MQEQRFFSGEDRVSLWGEVDRLYAPPRITAKSVPQGKCFGVLPLKSKGPWRYAKVAVEQRRIAVPATRMYETMLRRAYKAGSQVGENHLNFMHFHVF